VDCAGDLLDEAATAELRAEHKLTFYNQARLYGGQKLISTLYNQQRTKQNCWIGTQDYLAPIQDETCHCVARAVLFVKCTRKNDASEVHRLALCEVWRAKDCTVVPEGWPEAVPLEFARLGAEIYSIKKEEAVYFGGATNQAPTPGRSGAYHAIQPRRGR